TIDPAGSSSSTPARRPPSSPSAMSRGTSPSTSSSPRPSARPPARLPRPAVPQPAPPSPWTNSTPSDRIKEAAMAAFRFPANRGPTMDYQEFDKNRAAFPPEELLRYRGQFIAWSPDGTRIIASDKDGIKLDDTVKALGYDPDEVVFSSVPD